MLVCIEFNYFYLFRPITEVCCQDQMLVCIEFNYLYLFRPITEVCCQDQMLVCIEDPDEEFSIIPSRAINDGIATMIPKTPEQFIEIKGTVSVISNFMQ